MLSALLASCGDSAPDRTVVPLPIDTSRAATLDDAARWPHRRTIEADLNRDGTSERVTLAADVTLDDRGRPLWEDGHRWAAFVEQGNSRTLLYLAFVPNGHTEAAVVTYPDGARAVLIQERTPQRLRSFVISYREGAAQVLDETDYQVAQWVPRLNNP